MSNAHRPTWTPAVGEATAPTHQYSSLDLKAHSKLKYRRPEHLPKHGEQTEDSPKLLLDAETESNQAHTDTEDEQGEDDSNFNGFDSNSSQNEETEDDESEDEEALLRELQKIKQEKLEAKKALEDTKKREALDSNPLLLQPTAPSAIIKKSWTDDTVFRYQSSGLHTEKKRFISDPVKNDFHRKFIKKYLQ